MKRDLQKIPVKEIYMHEKRHTEETYEEDLYS